MRAERRPTRTSAADQGQEPSSRTKDPADDTLQAPSASLRLGAGSRWTTVLWALTTAVAAILVAGYTFRPPAAVGPADDPGPELDSSVSLPLDVDGVESCTSVMQDGTARGDQAGPSVASRSDATSSEDGAGLPGMELPCLTAGATVDPARLGGVPVVLNLWASWCTPCREEMPMLQQTRAREQGKVQFLGVNTKDRPDWAAGFLREVQVDYPQVVDRGGQLLLAVRSPGLPVTIVLDRRGRVAGQQVGRISQERLDALLVQAGA